MSNPIGSFPSLSSFATLIAFPVSFPEIANSHEIHYSLMLSPVRRNPSRLIPSSQVNGLSNRAALSHSIAIGAVSLVDESKVLVYGSSLLAISRGGIRHSAKRIKPGARNDGDPK